VVVAVLAVVALQVSMWHLGHINLSKISFPVCAVRAGAYRLPDLQKKVFCSFELSVVEDVAQVLVACNLGHKGWVHSL